MRCKQHFTDHSSIVGVCASCLRERLFYLVSVQSQSQPETLDDRNRNLDTHPVFPRSVSPYITRRKSDTSVSSTSTHPVQRFFSTPQVGPTAGVYDSSFKQKEKEKKKKKNRFVSFSLLSKLFRSKKQKEDEIDSDARFSVSVSNSRGSCGAGESSTSAMSSPFWFSNPRSSGRRNKQPLPLRYSDRGMSPVRYSDYNGAEDEFVDGSSGYETCESRKQTPWRTPARRGGAGGGGGGYSKNVSGLTFCLSPLVRASPCRLWNQKGMTPVAADGGDIRAPVKPHLANTKSFCANRSRKLADFGRFNSNH